MRLLGITSLLALVLGASNIAEAAEFESARVFPRFTFVELQYPQGVAASGGLWLRLAETPQRVLGMVGDLGAGLTGVTVALGLGASSSDRTSYEHIWSFGVQGIALRTWSWWSPWLPTSSTFAGGQVFAAYFAVRCSAGALWPTSAEFHSSWSVLAGCGVGLP